MCAIALGAPVSVWAQGSGSITGELTDSADAPVSDVWACAYGLQSGNFEEHCDLTDGDGIYSIAGLAAGRYKVEFGAESESPSYVAEFYDNKPYWNEADEIEVAEGIATEGIDAQLAAGAVVEGTIRAASAGGPVKYGLACAKTPEGIPVGCAQTNRDGTGDGTYALLGLPPAEYGFEFLPASNLYNLLNQWWDHKFDPADADHLTLTAGEIRTGIDADLEPGGVIRGTVYSAVDGSPLAGIPWCVLAYEEAAGEYRPAECWRTTKTGSYESFGLWTDSYVVAFSLETKEFFPEEEGEADGYLTQYYDGASSAATAKVLPLVAPEERSGIDAYIWPDHLPQTVPPPASSGVPNGLSVLPIAKKKRTLRCRAGFRKRKVMGKQRCVRIHRHKHHSSRSHG